MPLEETAGWRTQLPLLFVVLALVALVLVPVLMDRRTQPLRDHIAEVLEPARTHTAGIQAYLAYELSLVRGYLLTGDEEMLERYIDTQQEHELLYKQLRPLVDQMGPEIAGRFGELESMAGQRHDPAIDFASGNISREQFIADLPERQDLFEAAVDTARLLDRTIQQQEREYRDKIRDLRRLNRGLTVLSALIALGALLLVARISVRLRKRAEEEIALRRVAHSMAGALEIRQILQKFVKQSLRVTNADGAFTEYAKEGEPEVEVVASAGRGTPEPNTRIPYPGSLSQEVLGSASPSLFPDAGAAGTATGEMLRESCTGCSALVVPLLADEQVMGALVLLRRRGRSRFSQQQIHRACTLASLASLTIRKILLLEQSERHGAEMAHLLETRSRLIRGVSHDLKNPLGAADGYAELLESELQGELNQHQKEFVGRIRKMHRSMLDIIGNLVEIGRSDREDIQVQRVEANPARIARETAEDYMAAAELAGLELVVDIPDDLPCVPTDPVKVREIIGNLLSNAVKYTPSGGSVRVRAEERTGPRGPSVTCIVEDTGPGIAEAEQSHIFEEFHRVAGSEVGGSGIGLAISRKMARVLGGDITVRSRPGEGSTFTLWLPLDGPPSA